MTSLLYACVGFGGGSTYNALLILNDVSYKVIPLIALTCNIIVVSGGVWHFSKHKHINILEILPWISFSIPMAWVGGYIPISEQYFVVLLGSVLFLSSIKMLWPEDDKLLMGHKRHYRNIYMAPVVGGFLGFIAGLTGIGGGIFLAPVLHLIRWNHSKNIAGTCSLFILVNSLSGLLGHFMKSGLEEFNADLYDYIGLFIAVIIGGQIGSRLGAKYINERFVQKMTGVLILYVSVKLLMSQWYS